MASLPQEEGLVQGGLPMAVVVTAIAGLQAIQEEVDDAPLLAGTATQEKKERPLFNMMR